jgi:hypothetical protein
MKPVLVILMGFLNAVLVATAADLSTAPSQDLLAVYARLRSIQSDNRS